MRYLYAYQSHHIRRTGRLNRNYSDFSRYKITHTANIVLT
ncbi:unnamed protein product [Callosobruchus maculatus]|uniref:Uncharacterized protein n=1 Tax=Callosobruchus maculatus TaxID=64391 RepID=A0A653D6F6_CALMS|nr:unnamed protein product [Callosobruchus maculatus]